MIDHIKTSSLRAYVMIAVLALIWVYFHWATGYVFLTPRNLSNLMTQMSVVGVIAVGMLMVIVSGNIDLSVGSVLGFAGGVAAVMASAYPAMVTAGTFESSCSARTSPPNRTRPSWPAWPAWPCAPRIAIAA